MDMCKIDRYYTCEHDSDIVEGSRVECDTVEEGAIVYAHRCGDTSQFHIVYCHDIDTLEQKNIITLKYEMSDFKTLEVQ